jgi:hypothetical protein
VPNWGLANQPSSYTTSFVSARVCMYLPRRESLGAARLVLSGPCGGAETAPEEGQRPRSGAHPLTVQKSVARRQVPMGTGAPRRIRKGYTNVRLA